MRKEKVIPGFGIKKVNSKKSCQEDLAIGEFIGLATSAFGGFPACDACEPGVWKTIEFGAYWRLRTGDTGPSSFTVRCSKGHSRSLIGLFRMAPAYERARMWIGSTALPLEFTHRLPVLKCHEMAKDLADGKLSFPVVASRGKTVFNRVQATKLNQLLSHLILGAPVPTSHLGQTEVIGGSSLSRGVASSLVRKGSPEIFQVRSRNTSFYARPLDKPSSEQREAIMIRESRFKDYDQADLAESRVRRGYRHVQRTVHRKGWWFQTKDITDRPREIRTVILLINALSKSNLGSLRGKSRQMHLPSTICYAGIQTLVRDRSVRARNLRCRLFEYFFMSLMLSRQAGIGMRLKGR